MLTDNTDQSPVTAKNISYNYGRKLALRDVSFAICKSKITVITGPNGSGKSTLIKLILGLLKPSGGEIRLFGKNASRFSDWSRVGYVPQDVASNLNELFPGTVRELVMSGMKKKGIGALKGKLKKEALYEALDATGSYKLKDGLYRSLSAGEQQRVLLAHAIVGKPDLMILDEPLSSIDILGKDDFSCLLEEINEDLKATIIMVSHDVGVLRSHDHDCLCLNCDLVYSGHTSELDEKLLSKLYRHHVGVMEHKHD